MKHIPAFTLTLVLSIGAAAHAKPQRTKHRAPASINAQTLPDYRARALLRKQAPFVVEEEAQGQPVRINKDGTFTRAVGSDAYSPDGKWKVMNNHMKLRWNTGEEREYPVAFAGTAPVIGGRRANKRGAFELGESK